MGQSIDFTARGLAIQAAQKVRSTKDTAGYESWYIGTNAGRAANLTQPLKTMYTCIGYSTCGGEGAGYSPGANNAEITCIGWVACSHLTTGLYNTVVGVGSLRAETTGTGNTILGVDSMSATTGNTSSIGIGNNALGRGVNTSSIGIGVSACQVTSGGAVNNSICMGSSLGGAGVTTVTDLFLFGNSILGSATITNPSYDIVMGRFTLNGSAVVAPQINILIGGSQLNGSGVVSPQQNIFLGNGIYNNANVTNASYGVVIGYNACSTCYGNGNTILGYNAGTGMTSAPNNTIIGPSVATTTLKTGSANVLIGSGSATDTVTAATSNEVNIANVFTGYSTKPGVNQGYGTSPTVTGTGTSVFKVTVGTGGGSTTTVIGFPQAPTGWVCTAQDETTAITGRQSADTNVSAQITWSAAPAAGDQIVYQCGAY